MIVGRAIQFGHARHAIRRAARVGRFMGWLQAVLLALWLAAPAFAQQPVPPLTGRVVDQAGLLTEEQRASLASALESIEKRKGAQVAILTVRSTAPEPIETYALRVAETWKLGRGEVDGRAVDDGLLVLVASDDRRMRLEVGYGLEGAVPDATAKRIIEERMAPAFRAGDYAGGLRDAVNALAARIDGEPLPEPTARRRSDKGEGPFSQVVMAAFFGFVIGTIVAAIASTKLGFGTAFAAGAGIAWFQAQTLGFIALSAVGALMMTLIFGGDSGGGGRGRGGLRRSGRHTWTTGGGGWGGGGGFSGGGGGFGGGGASGSW